MWHLLICDVQSVYVPLLWLHQYAVDAFALTYTKHQQHSHATKMVKLND